MNPTDLIKKAIREKRSISFNYVSTPGVRVGNPHSLYTEKGLIKVDIYQTSGTSKSASERRGKLPGWREFPVEDLTDIKILDETFSVAPGYNPNSEKYHSLIVKT